jgi:hypothetical protein
MPQSRLTKPSHVVKGSSQLDPERKSVKDWLTKLLGQLWRSRTGPVLLKLSYSRETERKPQKSGSNAFLTCPLCGVVPINWTVHNKWCRFVTETKSTQTLLVRTDGAVRVPVDRATHPQQDSADTMQSAAERSWQEWRSQKHANVLTTPKTSNDEREMERAVGDSHPAQAVPEIRCVKCDATRTQLATHGDPGPCCNPFLTCSYEELWRSLPCGEDR